MNFALKHKKLCTKTGNCVSKPRNVVLKMMNILSETALDITLDVGQEATETLLRAVSTNEEFCSKNDELCIKNEVLCIKTRNVVLKLMNLAVGGGGGDTYRGRYAAAGGGGGGGGGW